VARGEVIARRFEGRRYDCGSKQGFLQANLAWGRRSGLID
jgi:UTP-glucose-1-phosphate uridylyltransferase